MDKRKRIYVKPTTQAVELKSERILCGSPEGGNYNGFGEEFTL